MKSIRGFIWMVLMLAGCTMSDTTFTMDQETDFGNYKTFAWLPKDSGQIQDVIYDNQLMANSIRALANDELFKRGYSIEKDTPDVLLQYTLVIKEMEQEIVNTQVVPTFPAGPNIFIPPYNASAYDHPANLYYYSNPANLYNPSYYINHYPYYSPYGFPVGPSYHVNSFAQAVKYTEGTLILDVIDRKTGELIWRGWNKEPLTDPATYERDLPGEITSIFRKYPSHKKRKR